MLFTFGLIALIQGGQFAPEEIANMTITMLGGSHRFDNIAGIGGMIVAMICDVVAGFLIRGKEGFAIRARCHQFDFTIEIKLGLVAGEELIPLIELECAGPLFLINNIGA